VKRQVVHAEGVGLLAVGQGVVGVVAVSATGTGVPAPPARARLTLAVGGDHLARELVDDRLGGRGGGRLDVKNSSIGDHSNLQFVKEQILTTARNHSFG